MEANPAASASRPPRRPPPGSAPSAPAGFLSRSGRDLVVDGVPQRLLGLNAYSLATDWSFNPGCGRMTDVDALFDSLPANTLVRFWAFQPLTTDTRSGRPEYRSLDRVVRAAERHGVKLVVVLGNHWGTCDAGIDRSPAWYAGGYARPFGDTHLAPMPFLDHVRAVVTRYRTSPAVGMWELLNEPEIPCAEAPVLRRFFDDVGGEVKRLDPAHLLGSGVIGSGQCGTSGDDYRKLHESPAIDVASYHDYDAERVIGGDQWNGLSVRMRQAAALDKPLVVGEMGMWAHPSQPGCPSTGDRRSVIAGKADGQLRAGIAAVVVWGLIFERPQRCAPEFEADDPLLGVVRSGPRTIGR